MRRRLTAVIGAVAVAATLAACSSTSNGAAGTSPSSTTSAGAGSSQPSSTSPAASATGQSSAAADQPASSSDSASMGSSSPAASGTDPRSLLPSTVKPGDTLTVANDPTDPPFDSIKGTTFEGVDYDVAQALGNALGVKMQFQQIGFDGIIPALQSGRFNMAMSAISDLKSRLDKVDFVDYFKSGYAIVVLKGNPNNITSLEDFCGRASAAQQGNEQVLILQEQSKKCQSEGKKPIDLKIYPQYSQMKLELQQGRLAAILQGVAGAAYVSDTTNGALEMVKTDDVISPSPYGIAFAKGSPLVKPFQAAMQQIIDDGTYAKILTKWRLQVGALTTATVNAATH